MAFLDRFTGDNDYRRAARSEKAAHEAATAASKSQEELNKAQAAAVNLKSAAEERAQFADTMANLTFSGEAKDICHDFEVIYNYWLDKDLKSNQKKVVNEKLELGMLALKNADPVKGAFYEKKVKAEKKKRLLKNLLLWIGIPLACIIFILIAIAFS